MSYASEDAEAAQRICHALRAVGIEVWFDQSELRGGDAWDREIRRQIQDCALFIPLVSQHSQERLEGYFRLEWKLAVDRSHRMAAQRAFIVPVVVDSTREPEALVPDGFREVQWTHLPGGEASPPFVARIATLLGPSTPLASTQGSEPIRAIALPVQSRNRTARRIALGLATLTAVVGVGWFAFHRSHQPAGVSLSAQSQSSAVDKSIAVLPFVDLSEQHDQGYFADGMTEELVDLLTQVSDLRVAARTSSFYFKGKSDDVAAIARTLHVAHLLEGSVRKAGDRLRVTVQLLRAEDGYHLWSQTYERNVTDIFRVQDEIAAAVVESLKVRLLPTQRLVNQHHTANVEAYAQYLLGNQLRVHDTPDSNSKALAAYRKAIGLDSAYAAAYSGLALTEWRIADQRTGEEAAYGRALAAADKAIALAPGSSDGYWARGTLRYVYLFDWSGAQADFDKALALDANDVRTMVNYARLLATLGRIADAATMTRNAIALDPLSVEAWDWLSYYSLCSGDMAAARDEARRALDINPAGTANDTPWIVPLLTEGPLAARTAVLKRYRESALFGTAVVEHSLGNDAESRRALDTLIRERPETWAFQIAATYAWRGENDQAVEWLNRAYHQHDAGMTRLTLDPLLRGLRGDPRFKALVRKMNLPE